MAVKESTHNTRRTTNNTHNVQRSNARDEDNATRRSRAKSKSKQCPEASPNRAKSKSKRGPRRSPNRAEKNTLTKINTRKTNRGRTQRREHKRKRKEN